MIMFSEASNMSMNSVCSKQNFNMHVQFAASKISVDRSMNSVYAESKQAIHLHSYSPVQSMHVQVLTTPLADSVYALVLLYQGFFIRQGLYRMQTMTEKEGKEAEAHGEGLGVAEQGRGRSEAANSTATGSGGCRGRRAR